MKETESPYVTIKRALIYKQGFGICSFTGLSLDPTRDKVVKTVIEQGSVKQTGLKIVHLSVHLEDLIEAIKQTIQKKNNTMQEGRPLIKLIEIGIVPDEVLLDEFKTDLFS